MLPLTVQSRYLQRRSVSHKEYTLRNEGGDTQSHWVGSPEFRFAFSISHFSAEIFPCTDCSCKRLPDFRMLLYASLKKYIYITPNIQLSTVTSLQAFQCTVLVLMAQLHAYSHLWKNLPLLMHGIVNATFAAQLTACLPHACRKVTECLIRQHPSCGTGRFRLDAWSAKSPDLRSLDYFL